MLSPTVHIEAGSKRITGEKMPLGSSLRSSTAEYRGAIRIFLFFVIFAISAALLDFTIKFGLREISTSELGALNKALAGKVNAEIIISGSSRALVHYDPAIIQEVTGKTTFNIGRNGSRTDIQLAFLKSYISKNRKPRLIIQNLDLHSFGSTTEIPDPPLYAAYLNDPSIYSAFLAVNPEVVKWRYVPLYCFAVEDPMFTWMLGLKRIIGINPKEDFHLGYNPRFLHWNNSFQNWIKQHPHGVKVDFDAEGVRAVKDLISFCQSEGIPLIFVFSPIYFDLFPRITNRSEIFSRFEQLASREHVPFWNYGIFEPVSYSTNCFYNSQHMNHSGAEVFSREIAVRLKAYLGNSRS